MLFETGPREILRDLMKIGWGLPVIIGFHMLLIACTALAWWAALGEDGTGQFRLLVWARWVREGANTLLPVAQVGGEIVGARLLAMCGTRLSLAAASVILDKTNEALAQIPFTLLGLALLVLLDGPKETIWWIALALPFAAFMAVALLLAQRGGLYRLLERSLISLGGHLQTPGLASIAGLDRTLRALLQPRLVSGGIALHLVAWFAGAGNVWLALHFMGFPIDFARALVIETLGQLVRSIGFIVPAGLGVQEGGYLAIGVALGVPPEAALAVSLVKRICQIMLGVPGLLSWQIAEARWLMHKRVEAGGAITVPTSASDAYVRRFVRALLRPLIGTGVTPNHLTTLRVLTGLGAAAFCSVGAPNWNGWAGVLWVVSALLDRGDGEFARLTRTCSERGRIYDYVGDVTTNSLIFLALGVGERSGALGQWSILLGLVAATSIAMASVLAEQLDLQIGEKSFPSRGGLDFDDILFALAPALWLGASLPLLLGAVLGGPAVVVVLWRRLSRLDGGRGSRGRAPSNERQAPRSNVA
jgi:putative membrane protein